MSISNKLLVAFLLINASAFAMNDDGDDNPICLDLSDSRAMRVSEPDMAISLVLDPTGNLLATGSNDNKARIFDIEKKECLYELDHGNRVDSVSFDPTKKLLATVSGGTARVWQLLALRTAR